MLLYDRKFIAKKIKEYRLKRGLTQAELAEKIDISTKQISRIELGDFYPSLSTFFKIIEILNINMSNFVIDTPQDNNRTRVKLIKTLYNASDEELLFYDRLLTFANDEVAELKKNILLKKF